MPSKIRSGQSIIEYTVIAAVVIMAVVFGGPFLVNSIQAHFRILDNNAQDSANEKIELSDAVPAELTACSCSAWRTAPSECGTGICSGQPYQREYSRTCDPMGCVAKDGYAEKKCVPENNCWSAVSAGACGTVLTGSFLKNADDSSTNPDDGKCVSRFPESLPGGLPVFLDQNNVTVPSANIQGQCVGSDKVLNGCAYNEKLYSVTRGQESGRTDTYILCAKDDGCEPACSGARSSQGTSCDSSVTLTQEVAYRRNKGANGISDSPERRLEMEQDDVDAVGAYRIPYAFVAKDACDKESGRACVKQCPAVTSSDNCSVKTIQAKCGAGEPYWTSNTYYYGDERELDNYGSFRMSLSAQEYEDDEYDCSGGTNFIIKNGDGVEIPCGHFLTGHEDSPVHFYRLIEAYSSQATFRPQGKSSILLKDVRFIRTKQLPDEITDPVNKIFRSETQEVDYRCDQQLIENPSPILPPGVQTITEQAGLDATVTKYQIPGTNSLATITCEKYNGRDDATRCTSTVGDLVTVTIVDCKGTAAKLLPPGLVESGYVPSNDGMSCRPEESSRKTFCFEEYTSYKKLEQCKGDDCQCDANPQAKDGLAWDKCPSLDGTLEESAIYTTPKDSCIEGTFLLFHDWELKKKKDCWRKQKIKYQELDACRPYVKNTGLYGRVNSKGECIPVSGVVPNPPLKGYECP